MLKKFLIFTALLILTAPAFAEETINAPSAAQTEQSEPVATYIPDFCEFTIKFPEDPYKTHRCENPDAENPEDKRCYDQISYTKVFDMSSTVNFRVICNPVNEKVIKDYSGQVMQATLRAMTKRSVVNTFDTSFREEENYKQAGLVGEGKVGKLATVYIAQLWIGKQSAFSVEAELIGEAAEAPDKLFGEILRSVHYKGAAAPTDLNTDKKKKE